MISPADHSARLITRRDFWPSGWAPDSSVVFAIRRSSNSILAISVSDGNPQTIATLPGLISDAGVSPDGHRFVCSVVEQKSDVWLMENFDPDR